jgi:hypothetical protein
MAIEHRTLRAGEILAATYKKAGHRVLVVGDEETGLGFELDGSTIYKSLSAAGSAVMGGTACNGWRFWTRVGEEGVEPPGEESSQPAMAAKAKVIKVIRKMRVQTGVPEGEVKYFCSACQSAFLAAAGAEVVECLKGHAAEQIDDPAPDGQVEAASD